MQRRLKPFVSISDDAADSNDNRKKKRKLDVKDVFNNDDDDSLQPKQKRKLVPIGRSTFTRIFVIRSPIDFRF